MTQPDAPLGSEAEPAPAPSCPIVGVGGSAGGLEAFSQLLAAFPASTGAALVIISHLDPDHPSLLAELLAKTTRLTVQVARDGMPIAPEHVYVLPPNSTLRLGGRVLRLSRRADSEHPHQPIDSFFQSLAHANQAAAIGIVLSGTGSDGTLGLAAIKAVGGTTLAQAPGSAAYPQMPQSAIATGCVDLVLPPAELASAVARLLTASQAPIEGQAARTPPEPGDNLQPLFTLVQAATGIDFSAYKRSTIVRRLQRRMALRQSSSLEGYLQQLAEHPDEAQALARDFLIGVTEFFRDPEAFAALQQSVLAPLLRERSGDLPVRAWVIGCATGQEAYSLAMLLLETAEAVGSAAPVQIFATDLNDLALNVARAGIYPATSVRSLTPARRERFLMPAEHGYRVSARLRECCVFARHNLLSDPPFSNLDLICCRNVLIYLSRPFQQRVFPLLHYALNANGVLMLGGAEQLVAFDELFTPLDSTQRLYMRTGAARKLAFAPLAQAPSRVTELLDWATRADDERSRTMQQIAHRIMATHYAQPGILITDGYDILHIYGYTDRYLALVPGETSMNVLRMARDGLLVAIQHAVEQAALQQAVARIEQVQLLAPGPARNVTLEVTPIRDPRANTMLFLIVFIEPPEPAHVAGAAGPAPHPAEWQLELQALRAELAASKAYMHTIIAEQAATNDELKLLNEELLSRNEEVQCVNEELQTAKEEVQSINEELVTVNEELQRRNQDISAINSDLHRLLASINIPIVMLDQSGAITRFTPPAARLLRLQPADIGRPLRDFAGDIAVSALDTVTAGVQQRGQPAEFPIEDREGHAYILRIWPATGVAAAVDGVILVWIDVAALRHEEATRLRLERGLLAAQKFESLGVLAGGVAHDFNNLLAIILGNTQMAMLDLAADAPAYPMLQQIEATSQRAIDLTRQMLAYAGKGHRALEVADLNPLIEATDGLLRASIGKHVSLRYTLSPAPLWAQIDTTQIRQVLVNLVLNAAEAAGPAAPTVTIRSAERRLDLAALAAYQVGANVAAGQYVLLEVEDSGVGMAPATVAKIFEPFFSTKFTGRGLGLAAVSGIVQGHGGAIRVQSMPEHGTTITIALPRAPVGAAPPLGRAGAPPLLVPEPSRSGGTVLVIDDEPEVRAITARLLGRLGFASVAAEDGAAGVAQLQQHAADIQLVLLDVTMPGMGTPAIIAALRAIRADIPILLMSGYPKDSLNQQFAADGFLPKPFTLEQLRDTLLALTSPRTPAG